LTEDKLVRMANQVASYFRSYPDEDAAKGISDHIESFWTPTMRRTLQGRINTDQAGISPLVVRALTALPVTRSPADIAALERAPGESPIRREVAGPAELGELASDAG
jgi:formate dehydrogenase subunit delta